MVPDGWHTQQLHGKVFKYLLAHRAVCLSIIATMMIYSHLPSCWGHLVRNPFFLLKDSFAATFSSHRFYCFLINQHICTQHKAYTVTHGFLSVWHSLWMQPNVAVVSGWRNKISVSVSVNQLKKLALSVNMLTWCDVELTPLTLI